MTRSESKYFATAARMDEALLELLQKKDFAYITVKNICEKAGVNRSTFYLHYETVDDLLEESARYVIDRFIKSMPVDASDFIKGLSDRPLDELYLITPEYLIPYLSYIKENRRIFKVSLEHASLLKMDSAYSDLCHYVLTPILDRFLVPSEKRKYIMQFYINGLMAIIGEWLNGDCNDSIGFVASVMQDCVRSGKDI